jgi:hypothetical protein
MVTLEDLCRVVGEAAIEAAGIQGEVVDVPDAAVPEIGRHIVAALTPALAELLRGQ